MAGESLEQAVLGLEMGLKSLKYNDYFNIIVFNDGHSTYANAPIQATSEEINKAIKPERKLYTS